MGNIQPVKKPSQTSFLPFGVPDDILRSIDRVRRLCNLKSNKILKPSIFSSFLKIFHMVQTHVCF